MIQDQVLVPCADRVLDVLLLRPPAEHRHPTALLIAGSSAGADAWRHWGKRLAERGVAVVGAAQPGFGRSAGPWDFAGAPTRAAFDALLEWTKAQPWVDPNRIALGGYSSGATNAFLLAARASAVVALVGAAGVYDVGRWAQNAVHPIADDARRALAHATDAELRERSPVYVADHLRCPVRLIHGGNDDVVPLAQAELMAAALRTAGVEPDVLIFPERSHSSLASPPFVDFLVEKLNIEY